MEQQTSAEKRIPRVMIAAAGSGSGKTTVTCGLLQAFLNRGLKPASFKCGPDYIDPMFHTEVLGVPSRNLDLFFYGEETATYLLCRNGGEADLVVLEGVMGYYDGLAGKSTEASSYDLAVKTKTPVLLVADCRGMSVSIAAVIKGFLEMRRDHQIKGVILNRLSPMLYEDIKQIIESELHVEVLGYLPVMKDCSLESRHLGLVTAKEIGNLNEIMNRLAVQIENTLNLDRIIELCEAAPLLNCRMPEQIRAIFSNSPTRVRIAVARDNAFCFYYQDNLELLEEFGAELVCFSPLEDERLPGGIQGLIIGGGYPELYLERLSENSSMLADIKKAIDSGIPCMAECGGFMYLHQWVKDKNGVAHKLAGVVEGESFPKDRLTRFGYITLIAQEDNLFCRRSEQLKGHEFHYWDSSNTGNGFRAEKPLRSTNWECVVTNGNLWAGYPHIHLYSNPQAAVNFISQAALRLPSLPDGEI